MLETMLDFSRAAEAEAWVFDETADGIFTFGNVCETLGIDPERLHAGAGTARAGNKQREPPPLAAPLPRDHGRFVLDHLKVGTEATSAGRVHSD